MKSRPILFSGPMVRAILDDRKTQTRRMVNPQPLNPHPGILVWEDDEHFPESTFPTWMADRCPYGQPGDRLWVRETWALETPPEDGELVIWKADREAAWRFHMDERFYIASVYQPGRWRPSIHMPRWASRLTLEVVSIRVERLHAITEADARAEGFAADSPDAPFIVTARDAFRHKWLDLYGAESWDANPWVWVVEFKRAS